MHGVYDDDKVAYVGSHGCPWHQMNCFAANGIMTAEEVRQLSNTNWKVIKESIKSSKGIEFPDMFITVREDTGRPLGIVTDRYHVVQNEQLTRMMDLICQDPNGPKFITGGSLFHGKQVWYLAVLPDFIKVTDNDIVKSYILITTGHNAKHRCKIKWVNTRVVCANTLGIAQRERGKGLCFKHTGDILLKVEEAQNALGIINENYKLLSDIVIRMSKVYPEKFDVAKILTILYPLKDKKNEDNNNNLIAQFTIHKLWEQGQGNNEELTRGTVWTLYNAITEYSDHYAHSFSKDTRNISLEKKMQDILWGQGSILKEKAFDLVLDLVK